MEHRRIGSLDVSLASLGCNNFGWQVRSDSDAAILVDEALALGVNFFDVADAAPNAWGASEEMLGRALGRRRHQAVICTKFGLLTTDPRGDAGVRDTSKRHVVQAADASLKRLGTDYIDLYLIHYPDPLTPIGETLEALEALVVSGKVREIGCSNFTAAQISEAVKVAEEDSAPKLAVAQTHYSVLHPYPESDLLPTCRSFDMTVIPFKALANGLLTGRRRAGAVPDGTRLAAMGPSGILSFEPLVRLSDEHWAGAQRLEEYAAHHGHTLLELALSYLAGTPGLATVLVGARTSAQLRANVAATTAWVMSDADRIEIRRLVTGAAS